MSLLIQIPQVWGGSERADGPPQQPQLKPNNNNPLSGGGGAGGPDRGGNFNKNDDYGFDRKGVYVEQGMKIEIIAVRRGKKITG